MFFLARQLPNVAAAENFSQIFQTLGLANRCTDLQLLDLPLTKISAEKLIALLRNNQSVQPVEVEEALRELLVRFKDELKGRHFIVIPSSRANYCGCVGTVSRGRGSL